MLFAAIHLFAHSDTKSEISSSSAKKLVAATSGVYVFIHELPASQSQNCYAFIIVYVYVRNVAGRYCVSSRPFLCFWNLFYHQQRCVNKICLQFIKMYIFFNCIRQQTHCSARFCESWRHICRLYYVQPHQQRCVFKIYFP